MRVLLPLLILLILPLGSFAQKFTTAVQYNDYIVTNQNQIIEEMLALNAALDTDGETAETVHAKRKKLLETINGNIKKVQSMPAYESNVDLRNSAVALFKFYKKMFSIGELEYVNVLY